MYVEPLVNSLPPITPILWLDLFSGFELASLDGIVLLATLVILGFFFVSRKSDSGDATANGQDEQGIDHASAANAAALSAAPGATRNDGSLPLPETAPGSLAQRASSVSIWPVQGLPSLSALSSRNATRPKWLTAPIAALALGVGLGFVWIGQRLLLGLDPGTGAFAIWFAGLLLLVLLSEWSRRGTPSATMHQATATNARLTLVQIAVLVGIGVASFYIWREAPNRSATDSSRDLVLLWLASIAGLIFVATGPPRKEHFARLRSWLHRSRGDILITIGIAVLAFIPRVYDLNSYPWALSGDEGTFAITARSVLRGELTNPFTSGPWGYPSLLFIFQGGLMDLAGETVAGARMLSAVLGTASVVAIYWLTRHHFGRWTGLIAAVIAASFNFHLFWSRDAQNAVAPMLFIPLALLFLDRGLVGGSRLDSLAAGLVIGFAQFFHPSNRILFPIAACYAVYALLYQRPENRAELVCAMRGLVPNVLWVTAGAIIGHLPLLAYFSTHPVEFSDRTNQVSVFASGWLKQEKVFTGKGAPEILWIQFQNAALLPFRTVPTGHYHPDIPFASWPLVIPLAIGMAIVTLTFWRRQSFGLALAFWATVAGIALTDGPPQTNRYTSSGPFLAIFAAIGIVAVATIAIRLVRLPRIPVAVVAAAATLLIAGWHLNWYFEKPNPVTISSDSNSQVANQLAREAADYGEGLTVYFAGTPRMTYGGFNTIDYIAPDATGNDIVEPWTASTPPPELTGPTLFAFLPERLAELDLVRAWFPGGETTVSTLPDGQESLITYFVDAPVVGFAPGHSTVLAT